MHKYRAKRTTVKGITFDSKKEAERYQELLLLERVMEISDLELQPSFILQDSYIHLGKKYREIKYVADFRYICGGAITVEDVKGIETPVFKLKWKMLLSRYGHTGVDFRIVK